MCGIAGILSRDELVVRRGVAAMVAAQRHRGPDGDGQSVASIGTGYLALGHSRLAIIDLSQLGSQPMIDPESGAMLVFNGEIYNFRELRSELVGRGIRFRSNSDSEVLLQALITWGPASFERLRGMFALAFFDPRNHSLLLARDPLGIKPLYVGASRTAIGFASEVRALAASGLFSTEVNDRAVASYLAYGAVQAPDTIFRGITPFPAGSWQRWDLTRDIPRAMVPQPYWSFPEPSNHLSEDDAVAAVRRTLDEAVRMHLVSDVPVGILLSSGIDSTIVASLAARHSSDVRTFTVGFAEHDDFSELPVADATARRLGTRHTSIAVTDVQARELLAQWVDSLDQPSMDGWNVFTVCATVKQHGVRVALSGQGGDELFGGYSSFIDVPRAMALHGRLGVLPRSARGVLASLGSSLTKSARLEKAADMVASDGSATSLYLHRRRTLSDRQMRGLGLEAGALALTPDFIPPESLSSLRLWPEDPIASISTLESTFYLGNMLLRDSDSNGMAHSLELRVPMLDTALLDVAYSLPGAIRLPNRRADKRLLRRAFPELLDEGQLAGPKKGFALPIGRWMAGPLRDFCESSLTALGSSLGLKTAGIRTIWRSFLENPDSVMWSRAWELCVLGSYISAARSSAEAA